jgi:hypothetical protein
MRLILIGVLGACVGAVACGRNDTVTPGNALVTPATADARRDAPAAPVATAGRAEMAPAATPATMAWREITIPAGTQLPVVLDTSVGSDTSRVEEAVTAHLARAITVQGHTALAAGSRVSGVVTDATRSGKVKGRAHVGLRFTSLIPSGDDQRYAIQTASVGRTAEGTKKNDALKIGAPAAGGAIIGALLGGKKGALIGTAAGGGAGTAVVLSTRGKEVQLPKGSALAIKLAAPVTVRVRG